MELDGSYVRHPYRGDDGTGLGKPLKSITHPLRADLPVRVAPTVQVVVDDDLDRAMLPVKASLAFYVGGMGTKDRNLHADLMRRFGHAEAADRVQKLFLADRRDEAVTEIPDALVDEVALVGPPARIRERCAAWRDDPHVTDMIIGSENPTALRLMADLTRS